MANRRRRYIIKVKGQVPADLPSRVSELHALVLSVGTSLEATPMDRYDYASVASGGGADCILRPHRIVTMAWQERDVTPDLIHRLQEVGVAGVVVRDPVDREHVPQPTVLRRVELLVLVICRYGEDFDAVEVDHVAGPHQMVHVFELLPHRSRRHHRGISTPYSRDVVFGKIVVVGMRQKDVICFALLGYSPRVDMDLDTAPPNPDRGLPEPGDTFEHDWAG